MTEHRAARLDSALASHRCWDKLSEVRLAPSDQGQSCNIVVEQTLLELGSRPKAILLELLRHHKAVS